MTVMAVTELEEASWSVIVASSMECLRLAEAALRVYCPGASAATLTSTKLAVPSRSLALLLPDAWILAAEPSSANAL